MKYVSVVLLFFLFLGVCNISAETNGTIITGGICYNSLLGKGDSGNEFEFGTGGVFELGFMTTDNFCFVIYGLSWNKSINKMESSEAKATFFVPYFTEFRWYGRISPIRYFFFFGYDLNKMRFEGHDGYDTQHLITGGGGLHFQLGKKYFIQFKAKTYLVLGNDLGQQTGLSLQAALGILTGR